MTLRKICISLTAVAVVIAGLAIDRLLTSTTVFKTRVAAGVVAGNSKTTCIYTGSSGWAAQLTGAERATGITFNCVETYSTADPTWSDWVTPWVTDSYGFAKWLAADRTNRTIIVTQQLIPYSVCKSVCANPLKWEQACDAGLYDSYATLLAKHLISAGFRSSVIRLGAEMNGTWENDYAGTTSEEQHAWAKCFGQEVSSMRAVKGEHFLFDWNVNACTEDDLLSNLYPGNGYVDIIGIDAYDGSCDVSAPSTGSTSAFAHFAAEPDGLNIITSFANAKGKPMSLPEWGTVNGSGLGTGDDSSYVLGIERYVKSHDIAFQCYFDDGDGGVLQLDSDNPHTLAAYIAGFG